jgi:hypothetical protein
VHKDISVMRTPLRFVLATAASLAVIAAAAGWQAFSHRSHAQVHARSAVSDQVAPVDHARAPEHSADAPHPAAAPPAAPPGRSRS